MAAVTASKVENTRLKMLEAARAVLRDKGYAALSTREVAASAAVPLSQIHYHFGSKQGLVIALFEYLNEQLLERQQAMFEDPNLTLSEQWDLACDYLDEDLASGYVSVLQELWAAAWSNPEIAEVVRRGILGWVALLAEVARRSQRRHESFKLLKPEELAILVGSAFIGAESFLLLGVEGPKVPVRRALRRVGEAIRLLENGNP